MDKQDELARVIGDASEGPGPIKVRRLPEDACREIAAAVRSFIGSEEVVNDAALAAANWENDRLDMPTLASFEEFRFQSDANVFVGLARAALSAAIGEDIGGGRG